MTTVAAPAPSMFAVFRRRDFTLLWLAQLVSTAGSALTDLAAGIYVWRATESTLAVALTLMVTVVPSLAVGLLAGVFVDRHDRQRIMMWTCIVQAVVVAAIAVVIEIDAIALPGLFVLLLLNAGVKQFFDPAHDSLIPEIASDEELAAANSFLSIASFGSTAIGFAGAGLLAGSVGLVWAFVLDAASFLFCAACISLMGRYPMPTPDDEASVAVIVENLRSGMRALLGTPTIRSLFVVGSFMFFAFGLWNVLLLPFSLRELGATEFQYGLQEGAHLRRLRRRLLLHGPVLSPAAGAAVARRDDDRHGGRLHPLRPVDRDLGGHPRRHRVGVLQRALGHRPVGAPSAEHAARDARPGLLRVLRHARRHLRAGMAAAGLADVIEIRVLIVFAGLLLFVAAGFTVVAPGLGRATWRATEDRLRESEVVEDAGRAATAADFDRLVGRLPAFGRLSPEQRAAFLSTRSCVTCRPERGSSSTATPPRPPTSSSTGRRRPACRSRAAATEVSRRWSPATTSGRSPRSRGARGRRMSWPTPTACCSRSRPRRCAPPWPCRRSSGSSSPP